jgi:N-acetylglutamate synthase-like GNAT family acetyltransferase
VSVGWSGRPKVAAFPLAVWERDGLKAALRSTKLPTEDVETERALFWRFLSIDDTLIGFGGLEIHAPDALLRSVVTLPPLRGRGFAGAIIAALEAEAALHHCRAVYLLTTGDAAIFTKRGYVPCAREAVPEAIRKTAQFASLCPAEAAVMVKRLD